MRKYAKTEVFDKVLAIDFDGTIAEASYPEVGKLRPGALEVINELYEEGYGIVINTCREGEALALAIQFMDKIGLKRHFVNSNFPFLIDHFEADTRKISADLYIDDKCLTGLPPWNEIYSMVWAKIPINDDDID